MVRAASPDRIAVVDLETTGLSPWRHDRVVEIAIVVISPDGQTLSEYETLVNPERDLGPTSIHQISAADVLRAPPFRDIAGDVLEILSNSNTIAGHNVSFDKNFLVKEYDRLDVALPEMALLCTCRLFGRSSLGACCEELGISFDGVPHRALSDARATARIVAHLCTEDQSVLSKFRLQNAEWPRLESRRTPCFCREHAQQAQKEPPRFLQRIASKIHHDADAAMPNVLAYLALIDRILEDRIIDENEEELLVDAATDWRLTTSQLGDAHRRYMESLAVLALADGVVSEAERRDLHAVARLLGQDDSTLDAVLESAARQLATAKPHPKSNANVNELHGLRVCFTGELQSTIAGEYITREMAEAFATQAGLVIASSVTKKLDILVVADPHTQSGKAKKARDYGVRILSDAVFWRMIGVTVD